MNEHEAGLLAGMDVRLKGIEHTVNKTHDKLFIGNGTPSIVVEVDRLKVHQQARSKHFIIIYTALAAAFFLVLLEWLANKGPAIIK